MSVHAVCMCITGCLFDVCTYRHLCLLVEPRCVYCSMSEILEEEKSLHFASIMVQSLNVILLTSSEMFQMRMKLRDLESVVSWSNKVLSPFTDVATTIW